MDCLLAPHVPDAHILAACQTASLTKDTINTSYYEVENLYALPTNIPHDEHYRKNEIALEFRNAR